MTLICFSMVVILSKESETSLISNLNEPNNGCRFNDTVCLQPFKKPSRLDILILWRYCNITGNHGDIVTSQEITLLLSY